MTIVDYEPSRSLETCIIDVKKKQCKQIPEKLSVGALIYTDLLPLRAGVDKNHALQFLFAMFYQMVFLSGVFTILWFLLLRFFLSIRVLWAMRYKFLWAGFVLLILCIFFHSRITTKCVMRSGYG